MKKKILSLMLCIVMVIGIAPVFAFADGTTSDWTYKVLNEEDKTAEITGYIGTDTELVFPEIIDGYTMVSIADEAFCGKSYVDYPITRVDIPETYKRIGESNFRYYRNLMVVNLPHGLEYIGADSFWRSGLYYENQYQCELKKELPVLYIGEYCITADQHLSGSNWIIYSIKPGTKLIASGAFNWNSVLKGIIIPEGVEYINDYAFFECTHMTSYVIPSTVKEIGPGALQSSKYGMYIKIPSSVTNIADDALGDYGSRSLVYGSTGSAAENFANISGAEFIELNDVVYGDVDGDGVVTVSDYASAESYSVGSIELNGNAQVVGDMNGDCIIDAFDAAAIDRII